MYYDNFDFEGPEPYENDLEDLMDREAFEDMVAERENDSCFNDYTDFEDEPREDSYLDSAYEDRTDLGDF